MIDSGSGSIVGGRDPTWKYCTPIEGNRNDTICNYCGMVIKSGAITRFKFHLSHTDPHSNSKCPNVPLEMKKEMGQLLVQRNKAKAKKDRDIEEIQDELQGTMDGSHRYFVDDDDNDDEDEDEDEEDDVYMYLVDMNPDEQANYQAACRASKASE